MDVASPEGLDVIGLSHVDLDSIGGVCLLMPARRHLVEDHQSFWGLAGFVDVYGSHRIHEANASQKDIDAFNAWRSWSAENQFFPPRDGSVGDAELFIEDAIAKLSAILVDRHPEAIESGRKWAKSLEDLDKISFKSWIRKGSLSFIVRRTDGAFVNALYSNQGMVADAVLSHNARTGAITLSFERPGIGDAREIMQTVFGSDAGGHAGIAGTPRNARFEEKDIERVVDCLEKLFLRPESKKMEPTKSYVKKMFFFESPEGECLPGYELEDGREVRTFRAHSDVLAFEISAPSLKKKN